MPNLYIIGGANGSGKTTAAREILPYFLQIFEYVNADEIAAGLSPFNPESVAIQAAGLFHSKYIFEYATTKASETLSLSHVLKAMIAIQIQGKISCDCPTLNESNGANATSIFSLSDITDIMNLVFDSPIASNSLSKA